MLVCLNLSPLHNRLIWYISLQDWLTAMRNLGYSSLKLILEFAKPAHIIRLLYDYHLNKNNKLQDYVTMRHNLNYSYRHRFIHYQSLCLQLHSFLIIGIFKIIKSKIT